MRKADAVAHFRSQRAVAAALGISEQAVSMWGDLVPEGRAYQLELLTKGKLRVTRERYSKRHSEHVT
ncbi:MAG TPA: Cro/CI family transcriptional regulator [Steroidobacteraceae bacterium]|nr:Cro/CI family transcriptional regulator [Steroidobacteraceae bacterium]